MKIGYPCINRSLDCTSSSTFRLASYSEHRFLQTVQNNLHCLKHILHYNLEHGLGFFRISSDIIPFASHPVCSIDWSRVYRKELLSIGNFIKKNDMRVSMHPDQFTLINSPNEPVLTQSSSELAYHAYFLDSMKLGYDAKIQIHIGGVYGDKKSAISRFIKNYNCLSPVVKNRLVIENDDRLFSLKDCLDIHHATGIPVLLDIFHHQCLNNGETLREALSLTAPTWQEQDGIPVVDYSLQQEGARKGKHRETINSSDFKSFLNEAHGFSFDLMLEIKDKEKSALKALDILKHGE